MSMGTRRTLIAVCVLSGALLLMQAGPNMMAQPRPGGESPGEVEGGSVLVEAFVVEVNLPALTRQGVSPIGGQPHAVTAAHILKCLDGSQAQVVSGGRISSTAKGRATVEAKRTTYVRREGGRPQASYSPYESGGELFVTIEPASGKTVSLSFAFKSTRFMEKQAADDVPPATASWEWSGSAVLDLGEPQIVGASQDSETAVFLLLVANTRK